MTNSDEAIKIEGAVHILPGSPSDFRTLMLEELVTLAQSIADKVPLPHAGMQNWAKITGLRRANNEFAIDARSPALRAHLSFRVDEAEGEYEFRISETLERGSVACVERLENITHHPLFPDLTRSFPDRLIVETKAEDRQQTHRSWLLVVSAYTGIGDSGPDEWP